MLDVTVAVKMITFYFLSQNCQVQISSAEYTEHCANLPYCTFSYLQGVSLSKVYRVYPSLNLGHTQAHTHRSVCNALIENVP